MALALLVGQNLFFAGLKEIKNKIVSGYIQILRRGVNLKMQRGNKINAIIIIMLVSSKLLAAI